MTKQILKSRFFRIVAKTVLWAVVVVVALSLTVSVLLMIPSIQTRVVKYATSKISEKTGMEAEIRSVNIGFPKTVQIEGLFLRDLRRDTLMYLDKLHVNAGLFGLLNKKINLDYLLIDGLKGNLIKRFGDSTLNIVPLLKAFEGKGGKKMAGNPWTLGFSEIELKSIRGGIESEPDSSYMRLHLGYLHILAHYADITRKDFDLKSITIDNTSLFIRTGRSLPDTISSKQKKEKKPMPVNVSLDNLAMSGIRFGLETGDEKMNIQVEVGKASIAPREIDLANFRITASDLRMDSADVYLKVMPAADSAHEEFIADSLLMTPYTFADIPWVFAVDHAEMSNTAYQMDIGPDTADVRGMDYLHMIFRDFNFVADSLFFNKNTTGATVSSLSITEETGGTVRDLKGKFFMDNTRISAHNVEMKTLKSWMAGNALLTYPALRLIGRRVEELTIDTDFRGRVFAAESRPFTDVLEWFPMLQNIQYADVERLSTGGPLKAFTIHDIDVTAGEHTRLKLHGKIDGLPYDTIAVNYEIDTFYTSRQAIENIISDTLLPDAVALPEMMGLKSHGKTGGKGSNAQFELSTDAGALYAGLSMKNGQFFSEIRGRGIDVGYILTDSLYGLMDFDSQIEGKIVENSWPDVKISTDIRRLGTVHNFIENLHFVVDKAADRYRIKTQIMDSKIDASAEGLLVLGGTSKNIRASIKIKNIDLHALGMTDDDFKIAGNVDIDITGKAFDDYTGSITARTIDLVHNDIPYHIAGMKLTAEIEHSEKKYQFTSDVLNASLVGNARIVELKNSLGDHLGHYITLPDSVLSQNDYHYSFDIDLKKPDFFAGFLIKDLQEFELGRCQTRFDKDKNVFDLDISMPVIQYADLRSENLSASISSVQDSMKAILKIGTLAYDASFVKNIELALTVARQNAGLWFKIHDLSDRLKYELGTVLSFEDSVYRLHFVPGLMVINYDLWKIPPDNVFLFNKNFMRARSTVLSRGDQKLWLETEGDTLKLNFEEFNILNFTNLILQDSANSTLAGALSGNIAVADPFGKLSVSSTLNIPVLTYHRDTLGNLTSRVNYQEDRDARAGLNLTNKDNRIMFAGAIGLTTPSRPVNAILETDIQKAEVFMPLFSGVLNDLDGKLTGRLALGGTLEQPDLNGRFQWEDLGLTTTVGNTFLRSNGQLIIENNIAGFHDFTVSDTLDNKLIVNGKIDLIDPRDPKYDIQLNSKNFLVVNSHDVEDETLIGHLALGIDATVVSKEDHLQVNANLSVNKETDITYIMPGQKLELISDAGIVEMTGFDFEEFETDNAGKKQFIGDSIISLFGNTHLVVDIEVDPEARFTVHLDPNSGDFSEFRLKGKLHYVYDDIRKGKLTGILEFEEGFYELSFYRLVKKRFTFDPGSTVTWSGDVMDGIMDFSARYTVRSNSVGLISNEISSYERSMYNQRLPYDVILKVTNKISDPEISFWIDLPQRHRANYPVIDAKLSMLGQPFMEAERNKQVFALLVAGTFIPEDPGSGASSSRTFATTAAVNSVNAIMTEQLNNLTGRFIKVVNIDMGVNTFEEYGSNSAQMRTQLDLKVSKNLFNDRVSVEVESHINIDGTTNKPGSQSTIGMTEFAVSYKITKSGNYRVKAFSENAYDIYDGEIQISGLAFIFVREFDRLRKRRGARLPAMKNSLKSIENE